jgi:hypothetical protein
MRAWSRTGRRTTLPMAGEPEDFILDHRFRKCTGFLLRKPKRGGGKEKPVFCGTAFFASVGFEGQEVGKSDWLGGVDYAVTASHVVKNTSSTDELYLRVNRVFGGGQPVDIKVPTSAWRFHAVTDVAVCAVAWPEERLEVMTIPLSAFPQGDEGTYFNGVAENEDVMICGLLTNFPGSERIQPIVRTGTIALMPYEKVMVSIDRNTSRNVDAYLLEMTSWPGLSGSPIIVYPNRNPMNPRMLDFMIPYLLLGLVHGGLEIDKEVKFSRERATVKLGSGIAVGIPAESIREVLMNDPELKLQRMELYEQIKEDKKPLAEPHSNEEPPSFTRQDFESDLRKASRRVLQQYTKFKVMELPKVKVSTARVDLS